MASDDSDEPRLLRSLLRWTNPGYRPSIDAICKGAYVDCRLLEVGTAVILLSFPRPLMPLFEFLYNDAKYSQSCLSSCETQSPGLMLPNFCVRYLSVAAWNLFWCDCCLLAILLIKIQVVTDLQVAQLRELLPTIIKLAGERFDLLVNRFVSTYVATLRKSLATNIATVRTLACVSPFVRLEASESALDSVG